MAIKTRVQWDVNEEQLATMHEMMHTCGVSTKKELVNNALTLFEWAIECVQKGETIASMNEKEQKYTQLVMPVLQYAGRTEKD